MSISKNKKLNKIKGALYGAAIGDAMGATTEFMKKEQIKKKYPNGVTDLIGGGVFDWKPGEVTDDTQMSMCIMRAVMSARGQYARFENDCIREFIKWDNSDPKDIGNTCAQGIRNLKKNNYLHGVTYYIFPLTSSEGNGGLMRAWPLAVLDGQKALNWNIAQNNITHNNKVCQEAIVMYTKNIQEYMKYGFEECRVGTTPELRKPTGWVVDTLNNALYYAWRATTFEDGIIWPVNDGGDSDTIACVTGGLVGARFGYDDIPSRWIEQLDGEVKNQLNAYIDYIDKYILTEVSV